MPRTEFRFFAVALLFVTGFAQAEGDASWRIRRDRWTDRDEQRYSEFVAALGKSNCHSFDQCLRNSANPYRESDPASASFYSDCADLPFMLRGYFAWKNGLPFSFVDDVAPVEAGGDIRYTAKGNRVTSRADIVAKSTGQLPNAIKVLQRISDDVSSAMLRFNPAIDDSELFTDLYPVALTRASIRPGTVIYDPNGHVAVVYQVESDGRVLYMDAHPDNSVTRGTYGKKFARANPGMGAGFKNWRPLRLVQYTSDSNGNLLGGRVTGALNREIPDFSTEQFFGNQPSPDGDWREGSFVRNGLEIGFYDYVRQSLSQGELKYEPLQELKNMLGALCQDLRDRADSVALAIRDEISLKPHPEKLPYNIYGASGEWESYSTPSRDARIKTSFIELKERVEEFLELDRQKSSKLKYDGKSLKNDLLAVFRRSASSCVIQYKKSDGSLKKLTLAEIQHRLFALSFDPYHCAERRWGETDPADLASCTDDALKARWYEGEQFMRNQVERTYDARMDFTVDQLFIPQKGNGVTQAPSVDWF